MKDDWTKEIRERLDAATPGLWEADGFTFSMEESGFHCLMIEDDAKFIANAPTDIARLLEEREVMREALKFYVDNSPPITVACDKRGEHIIGVDGSYIYKASRALAYLPKGLEEKK